MILTSGCCVGLVAVTPGPGTVPVTRVGAAATRGARGGGVLATAHPGVQASPVGSPVLGYTGCIGFKIVIITKVLHVLPGVKYTDNK